MLSNVVSFSKTNLNPFEEIKSTYAEQLKKVDSHIKLKLSSHVELVGEMATHLMKTGGKRLRPLTYTLPKPLIEVNGSNMISRIINSTRSQSINKIFISFF